jgi:hypothetical protein
MAQTGVDGARYGPSTPVRGINLPDVVCSFKGKKGAGQALGAGSFLW